MSKRPRRRSVDRLDFLVVGTMKSGTTSLRRHLRNHPEVYIHHKELHYFEVDELHEQGDQWYLDHFRPLDSQVVVGEKTPGYCFAPAAAQRIHAFDPAIKLVWIYREPLDRAHSNYWHAVRAAGEHRSLRACWRSDAARAESDPYQAYFTRSHYASQLDRFLDLFPDTQMHHIVFEQLRAEPAVVLDGLARFLEVGPFPKQELSAENVGEVARFRRLNYLARHLPLAGRVWVRQNIHRRFVRATKPSVPVDVQREATESFRPEVARLATLTGLELDKWWPAYASSPSGAASTESTTSTPDADRARRW